MFEMLKSTDMFQASWELLIVFALLPIRASKWTLSWCKNLSRYQAKLMNSKFKFESQQMKGDVMNSNNNILIW